MTVYFMSGTDEQVQFGEYINTHKVEKTEEGLVHKAFVGVFEPEVVDFLLEKGIIEEREIEDPEPDFVNEEEVINDIIQGQVDMEEKIDELEEEIKELKKTVNLLKKTMEENAKKQQKPKGK